MIEEAAPGVWNLSRQWKPDENSFDLRNYKELIIVRGIIYSHRYILKDRRNGLNCHNHWTAIRECPVCKYIAYSMPTVVSEKSCDEEPIQ